MNTQYKDNVTAIMQVNKKYVDDKFKEVIELVADYDISTDVVSQLSTSATAPSDVRSSSLIQVGGNCVKYAPSTASDDTTANLKAIPSNTYSANVDTIGNVTTKTSPSTASDSSVSKMKSIPLSTFTLGIDYVGGMSYKYANLITDTQPIIVDDCVNQSGYNITSLLTNGKTYYIKGNVFQTNPVSDPNYRALVVKGKVDASTFENIVVLLSSGNESGSFDTSFVADLSRYSSIRITLSTNSGGHTITLSDLSLGTKPYFSGLRSAKVSEIVVSGTGQTDIVKQIPSAILNNEYYGLGYDDTHCNKLNCITKNIEADYDFYAVDSNTEVTKSHNDTGTGIGARVIVNSNVKPLTDNVITNLVNLGYHKIGFGSYVNGSIGYAVHNSSETNVIYVRLGAGYDTTDKVKTYLINNNVQFLYEMASQVVVDVSSYIDDSFKTFTTNDQYTDIEMVNEYGYDMPNKVEYYGKIDNDYADSVVFSGNLLNISNVAETTLNGITYKVENGVITLSGTASSNTNIDLIINHTILNGTYYLESFIGTLFPSVANLVLREANSNIINIDLRYRSGNSFTSDKETYILRLYFSNGAVLNNLVVKPMLVKGSTAPTEYKPYVPLIPLAIPSQIKALDGYEYGTTSTPNFIDFCNKKFNKVIGKVDLGTLTWSYNSNGNIFATSEVENYKYSNSVSALSDIYNFITPVDSASSMLNVDDLSITFYVSEQNLKRIYVKNTKYGTDATAFKNAMSGVYLYYELTTPVQTDISSYLDNFNPILTNDNYTNYEVISHNGSALPNKISYFGIIKETLVESMTITNVGEQPQTINLADTNVQDGWSVSNSIYNYRADRERKRHKLVGRVDLGTLTYTRHSTVTSLFFGSTSNIGIKTVANSQVANILCANYTTMAYYINGSNDGFSTDKSVSFNNNNTTIAINDSALIGMTNEQVKLALSGIYLYYELATEVVEDLDVVYDSHYIPLKSGGSITFNNANAQQCHNTIRYTIMEEKQ